MSLDELKYILVSAIRQWIPLGIVITFLAGLNFLTLQQYIRQAANDPQIEMAEDAAADLRHGTVPQEVVSSKKVDIGKSLAPYMIIYDQKGEPVASSGEIDKGIPVIPKGVMDSAKNNGLSLLTWQPKEGARGAIAVMYYEGANTGYVLAGKSLRETERRLSGLQSYAVIFWAAAMSLTLFIKMILSFFNSERGELFV